MDIKADTKMLNDELRNRGFGNEDGQSEEEDSRNQLEILRDEIMDRIEYFQTDEGIGFAKYIMENGQAVTTELTSGKFKKYVRRLARSLDISPAPTTINTAVEEIQAQADLATAKPVFLRTAYVGKNIHIFTGTMEYPEYYELNTATGTVTKIDNSPVEFIPKSYLEKMDIVLETAATTDDNIFLIQKYINADDQYIILILTWLCSALMPEENWEYAQLNFIGSKGSGKSTTMENLARIIDNSEYNRMIFPSGLGISKATENLFVNAYHNWCLSYDNVVRFKDDLAMVLAVFTTGNAQMVRKLFSDNDQVIMSNKRPVILNYISQPHDRSDLLDRSIVLEFKELTGIREDDQTMRELFENDVPKIRGFIFQTLAKALHLMQTEPIEIDRQDRWRVTHFYKLGRHIEKVLNLPDGTFHKAIWETTENTARTLLAMNEYATGIKEYTLNWEVGKIEKHTPNELLQKIKNHYRNLSSLDGNYIERYNFWKNKKVSVFGRELTNVMAELRLYGLKVTSSRDEHRYYIIEKINNGNTGVVSDGADSTDGSLENNNNLDEDPHDLFEQGRLE
tara:strand:+ start:4059 stop:5756 length:1698 start_codon:yes stop_codon:yes gene_type:complete